MKKRLNLQELEVTSFVTALPLERTHLLIGGATGTCAGSGCAECKTLHGSECMTQVSCPVEEEPVTIIVDPDTPETIPG